MQPGRGRRAARRPVGRRGPGRLARRRERRGCAGPGADGPGGAALDDRRGGHGHHGPRRARHGRCGVIPSLEILPVAGIGEVRPGDNLADVITSAAGFIRDGDVLVVTSKIVSKAEGRLVDLPPDEPAREAAREAALQAETVRVVARRGATRIVQTHHGLVLAAGGIDASNVDAAHLVLLPKDPDASARALREELRERFGLDVAVVITDTMGRPWRLGLTDVAIGAAGVDALLDYRGLHDAYGNELQLTQMAQIDQLAAAGELVKGKTAQVPVAIVRGLAPHFPAAHGRGAAELIRGSEADLFSLGTAEATARGLRLAGELPDATEFAPADAAVRLPELPFPRTRSVTVPANTVAAVVVWAPAGNLRAAAEAGRQAERLRAVLAADGLATAWLEITDPAAVAGDVPAGGEPLGVLAIGRGSLPSL
ncbi:coenzyme F420-0:L-glutamate ligase [Dactylosporangium matsuzakiense]|nr:coenzyme F420-0:L-glutamate ligase [Dactylosporangium matsuzakiense]